MSHGIREYASDLTQQEWEVIKPFLFCERKGAGRPMELEMRQVMHAIFYVLRTGACINSPISTGTIIFARCAAMDFGQRVNVSCTD